MASLKSYSSGLMNANVYVPENVNENTEVFVFVHGGGTGIEDKTNDWNSVINYQINQNGSDSIIVMPSMGERYAEDWASNTMDIIENVREDYGITNMNVTSSGFSNGGWGAARTTIENIQRNPELEPQVLFLLDDYGNATVDGTLGNKVVAGANVLNNGGQEAFLQNDTIIFSYVNKAAASGDYVTDKTRQLDTFAESGVNLVRVVCDNGEHQSIKNNFFQNGLADYTNGNVTLPTEGYTYQKAVVTVDPETGEKVVTWENINVEDISTKEQLYNYFGIDSNSLGSSTPVNSTSLSVSERDVFVELAALQEWSSQLKSINEDSISQLKLMITTVESLRDSWEGNFSDGFIEDCSNVLNNLQKIHNEMNNLSSLLIETANTEDSL